VDLSDQDFQRLQLIGITLIIVGGIEYLNAAAEKHLVLLERGDVAERQHAAQLQKIHDDLESLAGELAKVRNQQVRDAISLEAIVAGMPASGDGRANHSE
jgi:hypothetical protein